VCRHVSQAIGLVSRNPDLRAEGSIDFFNSKHTAHHSRHHIVQETFDTPAEMNVFDDAPLACQCIASIPRGLRARWRKRHIRLAMRNLITQVTASSAISRKMFLVPLQAARW
jgi:aryl carrier-like protein